MKKIISALLLSAFVLAGCQKSDTDITVSEEASFTASVELFDTPTRTSINSQRQVVWSQDDRIAIFQGSAIADEYKVTDASAGKMVGTFDIVADNSEVNGSFTAGTELPCNVAFYPYTEDLTLTGSVLEGKTSYQMSGVVLPSVQQYTAGSFANGAFPMVAVTGTLEDHNLKFKNVLGAVKLQLKGTQNVVSVKIEGKNNEILSGAATVTAYTNNLTPAITMTGSDDASKSVTLNCGTGVQLSESTATEFIIALPPILFSQGFTVTVTDSDSETYTVETNKANTVLRSSLLVMPTVKIADTPEIEGDDDESVVSVEEVALNKLSLTLPPSFSYTLTATIVPNDAAVQTVTWSSSDASVATVDQNGVVVAISDGTSTITAEAGGVTATCKFTVIAPTATEPIDYIVDEINYGKGIVIGDLIWAPVNCGYHATDFPYGKHYQWGRKYGQGLSGSYDDSEVTFMSGPISSVNGQKEAYADYFFTATESPYDWVSPSNDALWNSGTEENPVKTDNDPCPEGWRVPTHSELSQLSQNHSGGISSEKGLYFSGDYTYIDGVPRLFLPASGYRSNDDGGLGSVGNRGLYWSVTPSSYHAYYLNFYNNGYVFPSFDYDRANGCAVRCLQVIDEVAEL